MNERINFNPTENREQFDKRVLLADDDEILREGLRMTLESLGCEVALASDGLEILEILEHGEKFDVVVTDNNMLRMNGLDALKKIRNDPRFAKLPVILGSGSMSLSLLAEAESFGAICLHKPYGEAELKEAFRKIFT